jgi:hypothetical protein
VAFGRRQPTGLGASYARLASDTLRVNRKTLRPIKSRYQAQGWSPRQLGIEAGSAAVTGHCCTRSSRSSRTKSAGCRSAWSADELAQLRRYDAAS